MYELSLHAGVPERRYGRVKQTLMAMTGMVGVGYAEHVLVFQKPTAPAPGPGALKRQRPGDVMKANVFMRLVTEVDLSADPSRTTEEAKAAQRWSTYLVDTPEPGDDRQVTQRTSFTNPLPGMDHEQAQKHLEAQGYTYTYDYVMKSERYTYRSIQISLQRFYKHGEEEPSSNDYLMEALIRVEDSANGMREATEMLKQLRADLRGVCDLEVVARDWLDVRVR
ncbi:Mediator of RNA polymerase II transcription subunit 18 [Saitoella coloradoensis]